MELNFLIQVPVKRGTEIIVKHVDNNLTIVTNHGVAAKIVQGDIKCSNGYIHMIDTVLTKVCI